jgi:hypothetical protein
MGRKILKLYVERDKNKKYSLLYTKKGLETSVLVEGLTKKQVESIYSLLQKLGFDVFFEGIKADLKSLNIPKTAKIHTDDIFVRKDKT